MPIDSAACDALCQRDCSFALYRLAGEGRDRFCMQQDGGMNHKLQGEGFLLAPYGGEAQLIAAQCDTPLPADNFAPLPEAELPLRSGEEERQAYSQSFHLYHSRLFGEGALGKVVLARCHGLPCKGISPTALYRAACAAAPQNYNALFHTASGGTWLCSSPELLLCGQSEDWESMALAGTRPISPEPWDDKNRREQEMVEREIRHVLLGMGAELQAEPPNSLRAGTIEHICSRIRFRLPATLIPRLLKALPPTPAVCGYPKPEAQAFIAAHPDCPRGYYAGYSGPWAADHTSLYVTLRCARLYQSGALLYAGGGLLPASTEDSEWQETEAKMQQIRRLAEALACHQSPKGKQIGQGA